MRLKDWDGKKTNVVINAPMEEVIKKMKVKPDTIFTSPPYGIGEVLSVNSQSRVSKGAKIQHYSKYDSVEDSFTNLQYSEWLQMCIGVVKIVFWNVPVKQFRSFGVDLEDKKLVGQVMWSKTKMMPFSKSGVIYSHEYIWVFGDPKRIIKPFNSVWRCSPQYGSKHPAPFPPELPGKAIMHTTQPGDLVFDPFGGSGTTAAVAKALKRRYLTCDVSSEYCRWMEQRLAKTRCV